MADPREVRVINAQGNIFNFSRRDAERYMQENPGSRVWERQPAADNVVDWRRSAQATSAAQASDGSDEGPPSELSGIKSWNKARLEEYAAEHNIDLSAASNNDARVQAILAAASAAQSGEADGPPEDLDEMSLEELVEWADAHQVEYPDDADADAIAEAIRAHYEE